MKLDALGLRTEDEAAESGLNLGQLGLRTVDDVPDQAATKQNDTGTLLRVFAAIGKAMGNQPEAAAEVSSPMSPRELRPMGPEGAGQRQRDLGALGESVALSAGRSGRGIAQLMTTPGVPGMPGMIGTTPYVPPVSPNTQYNEAAKRSFDEPFGFEKRITERRGKEINDLIAQGDFHSAVLTQVRNIGFDSGVELAKFKLLTGALPGGYTGRGTGWKTGAIKTSIQAAKGAIATYLTTPGKADARIKSAAYAAAYLATPAASSLAPTNVTAVAADILLNSGISFLSGQHKAAIDEGIAMAEAEGRPEKAWQYAVVNLLPVVGPDIAFSLMTRSARAGNDPRKVLADIHAEAAKTAVDQYAQSHYVPEERPISGLLEAPKEGPLYTGEKQTPGKIIAPESQRGLTRFQQESLPETKLTGKHPQKGVNALLNWAGRLLNLRGMNIAVADKPIDNNLISADELRSHGLNPDDYNAMRITQGDPDYVQGEDKFRIEIFGKTVPNPDYTVGITLSNRSTGADLVEELAHAAIIRLRDQGDPLYDKIVEWENRVIADARKRGVEVPQEAELFAMAWTFSQMGHAKSNKDLANLVFIPTSIKNAFNDFFGRSVDKDGLEMNILLEGRGTDKPSGVIWIAPPEGGAPPTQRMRSTGMLSIENTPKGKEPSRNLSIKKPDRNEPWQMTRDEFESEFIFRGVNDFNADKPNTFWGKLGLAQSHARMRGVTNPRLRMTRKSNLPKDLLWIDDEPVTPNQLLDRYGEIGSSTLPIKHDLEIPENGITDPHRYIVEQAIKDGKPVPPEVLKDYPDLAKKNRNLSIDPGREAHDPEAVKTANSTARFSGAVGANAVVPRKVALFASKGDSILDFGSGPKAMHTRMLRSMGHDVTAYEYGANFDPNVHDPKALDRKYDVVMASNVLNVQPTKAELEATVREIAGATERFGRAVMNYPESPRKGNFSPEFITSVISKYFDHVRIEGNVYIARTPSDNAIERERNESRMLSIDPGRSMAPETLTSREQQIQNTATTPSSPPSSARPAAAAPVTPETTGAKMRGVTSLIKNRTRKFPSEVRQGVGQGEAGSYVPMVQKEELAAAAGRIASDINNVEANVFDPEAVVTKEYSANAIELAKHYVGLNDYEGAIRVFNAMAPKLTESGQGASMLASITDMATEKGPATIIYMTRKLFERVKKNVNILAATGFAEYPKMTPELAEEITRRVDDIKTMDNPVAKEQATKDMWRMICNKIPPSASSWIDSFRYSNVIGERAIGTNIMNNAMDQFIVYPSTKIGAALSDSVRSVGGKKREHLWGEVPIAVGHQMKGLVSGIKSALRVLGNIEDISHPDTRGYGEDYAEVYRSGRRQTRVPFPYDIRIRIMDAFDRISSNMLGRAELDALNYRESKAVQVDNKQQRVDRMVQEMFYRRPVDPKGKKSGQGHLFRIMDIPMQYLTKLQNDTSSWQAKVAGSALKLPVMFVRMSTSLAKLLIEYSPAGVATIPGSADKSLQISKAFIGSLIYVWAAAMSSTHDTVTTLSRNKTARAEELEAGLIPWSIKIGGKYRSFVNFGPFGMALAVTAIYKDIFKKGDPTESQKMKMLKAVGKTLQYYGSMTANKGVNDMTNALLGQEYAMANALTNPIRQFTPWASSMRTVQQIIDPYYRDPGMDVWDSWKANMPYLSESTPPLLTGAGNKVYRQYRAGNALLPWATSEIRDQDLYNSVQGRKLLNVNQSALDRIKEDMRRGKINRADINARTKKLLEYNKRNRMNQ